MAPRVMVRWLVSLQGHLVGNPLVLVVVLLSSPFGRVGGEEGDLAVQTGV